MTTLKRSAPALSTSSSAATKEALEDALRSNLRLQAGLVARVKKVFTLKAENRREARLASVALLRRWEMEDSLENGRSAFRPLGGKELKKVAGRERRRREREWYASREGERSDEDGSESSSSTQPPLQTVSQMTRRWAYKEDRKWARRYFVDPDGNVPEPNEDTVRKEEEEEDAPFLHRCFPWSEEEVQSLRGAVNKVRMQLASEKTVPSPSGGDGVVESIPDSEIDFGAVASLLRQNESKGDSGTAKRSFNECRLKYLAHSSPSIEASKITPQESCKISEMVRLHDGHPSWDDVAASLRPGQTPWQCFQHHTSLQPDSRPWMPEEDEFLLKYIAAHGPGFLLNPKGAATDIAARLFPDRTITQVTFRANASLLNPNYKNEAWSDEEERRLALCMRVYRDAQSPLARANVHFPDRASKSVSEKWLRSLDPEITYKPFVQSENRKLLQTVEDMGGPDKCSWVQLARQHFPSRNPRSLKYRWMDVASDADLERKYKRVKKAVK